MTSGAAIFEARGPAGTERRLAICSSGIPHTSRGASAVLFFHYVERLKREGYRILHLLLLEGDAWPDAAVESYRRELGEPGRFEVAVCRSRQFVHEGRMRHRLDERAAAEARHLLRAFAPDLLLAFDILPAWIMQPIAGPRLVWLGDLRFETVWFHALYASRESPRAAVHLLSNWLCCRTWERRYAEILAGAERIVVASHSSVARLARLGLGARYEPYPWPDTTGTASDATRVAPAGKPAFLFFGTLTGLGSRSALHFILGRVFPRLRRLWGVGGFRILLAGRGEIPGWAAAMMEGKPEFERLGFVEDLDALLRSCHGVLVPIDVPVGNRSRILTAWAKRALVIAHANAALGNPDLADGRTGYLASDPDRFVDSMRRAVTDRNAVAEIVENAYAVWNRRFRPEAAADRLAEELARLAGPSGARPRDAAAREAAFS